ncbi:hypothetical protein GCM10010256_71740 [Streptomyces coeruleorubidus]|nr:hypothetical protein GCM10010256_71740 [Streptomyces coeruleorubidus]
MREHQGRALAHPVVGDLDAGYPHRVHDTRLRAGAGGVLSADSPGTRRARVASYPWSATKAAMRVRAAFQLIVCSLVDQDWMSSM